MEAEWSEDKGDNSPHEEEEDFVQPIASKMEGPRGRRICRSKCQYCKCGSSSCFYYSGNPIMVSLKVQYPNLILKRSFGHDLLAVL